jgi:hypothetical protein
MAPGARIGTWRVPPSPVRQNEALAPELERRSHRPGAREAAHGVLDHMRTEGRVRSATYPCLKLFVTTPAVSAKAIASIKRRGSRPSPPAMRGSERHASCKVWRFTVRYRTTVSSNI